MKIGIKAPDFELNDGDGNKWKLSDHLGETIALLFYPGDNTPVCTKQLCSVRDNWDDYLETGATVIGISTDSAESHKDFKEKHGFPFTLLADENGRVVSAYGAKSWIPGKSARAVVVIDKQGNIASHKVQSLGVFAPGDDEVIAAIRESQSAEN